MPDRDDDPVYVDDEDDIGTVRWFGERYDAPAYNPRAKVDTPVGARCGHHHGPGETIVAGDQGVGVPFYDPNESGSPVVFGGYVWYHLACWFHTLGLSPDGLALAIEDHDG